MMAAASGKSLVYPQKAAPQSLTTMRQGGIFQQLHTFNQDNERSANLSLFWIFDRRTALRRLSFYPFLKPGMRFSGCHIF
jgi:hypothetical protein